MDFDLTLHEMAGPRCSNVQSTCVMKTSISYSFHVMAENFSHHTRTDRVKRLFQEMTEISVTARYRKGPLSQMAAIAM